MDKAAQKSQLCFLVVFRVIRGSRFTTWKKDDPRITRNITNDQKRVGVFSGHHVDLFQVRACNRQHRFTTVFVALHVPRGGGQ